MGIIKIYFFFYLSLWLGLLLIVCGNAESNLGSGSDKRVRVLYSNIRGLHANFYEFAVAGSDYDVLICSVSKVSDSRHLSELCIPCFCCPQQRFLVPRSTRSSWCPNSTPGAQGMAIYVMEGFRSFRQRKLECSCHASCVFRICSTINNFYVYEVYRNPGHNGSLYDCLLDSMARVQ